MINNESYYDILEADCNATREELKQCYQRLVRKHHPDKSANLVDTSRFQLVDLAWKTLSDDASRKEYDAQLASDTVGCGANVTDSIELREMTELKEDGIFVHPCRCGGRYELPVAEELDGYDSPILVECNTCSLYISITDFDPQTSKQASSSSAVS